MFEPVNHIFRFTTLPSLFAGRQRKDGYRVDPISHIHMPGFHIITEPLLVP